MIRKLLLILLISCSLATSGCILFLAGTGAGAGVYSYIRGELKGTYQSTFDNAVRESIATLESLKITVTKKTSSGLKTKIIARRTDGTPVTVKVEMLSPIITEISVRTGVIGLWDKKNSELIHASIAQRL